MGTEERKLARADSGGGEYTDVIKRKDALRAIGQVMDEADKSLPYPELGAVQKFFEMCYTAIQYVSAVNEGKKKNISLKEAACGRIKQALPPLYAAADDLCTHWRRIPEITLKDKVEGRKVSDAADIVFGAIKLLEYARSLCGKQRASNRGMPIQLERVRHGINDPDEE